MIGIPVSSRDVKFTDEAIMNPRNLSPRISDYEPVKSVEAVDPLTVEIVYKRLCFRPSAPGNGYSPGTSAE